MDRLNLPHHRPSHPQRRVAFIEKHPARLGIFLDLLILFRSDCQTTTTKIFDLNKADTQQQTSLQFSAYENILQTALLPSITSAVVASASVWMVLVSLLMTSPSSEHTKTLVDAEKSIGKHHPVMREGIPPIRRHPLHVWRDLSA